MVLIPKQKHIYKIDKQNVVLQEILHFHSLFAFTLALKLNTQSRLSPPITYLCNITQWWNNHYHLAQITMDSTAMVAVNNPLKQKESSSLPSSEKFFQRKTLPVQTSSILIQTWQNTLREKWRKLKAIQINLKGFITTGKRDYITSKDQVKEWLCNLTEPVT